MKNNLKREIIVTDDGSTTIHFPQLNEQYHSKHGAINEANHVFIKHGLEFILNSKKIDPLHILEIGLGTGLNAFITCIESLKRDQRIKYVGVEAYPIGLAELSQLNYGENLSDGKYRELFDSIHQANWEESSEISKNFTLTKKNQFFQDIDIKDSFDLIYFDAFGARVQPELWTKEIFQKMMESLHDYGVLVTYSAKGSVRRALQEVGFVVERLPGPPGKREMLRAIKGT